MMNKEVMEKVEAVRSSVTPALLKGAVGTLLQQGEDVGGGINASRLVRYLLDDPHMQDEQVAWAYDRLKPAFRAAFEEIPSLYYFEGD